jgi:hypothetical protein
MLTVLGSARRPGGNRHSSWTGRAGSVLIPQVYQATDLLKLLYRQDLQHL